MRPVGKDDIKVRSRRTVGIAVTAEKKSPFHRTFDLLEDRVDLVPVLPPACLEVRDLRLDPGRLRKLDHLIDRLENPVALRTHVRRVVPALRRGDLRELGDLLRRRVLPRLVDESRGESPTTLVKRLLEETRHFLQLRRRGHRRPVTDNRGAQRVMADELDGVDRGLRRGKDLAVFGERMPGETVAEDRGPVGRETRLAISWRDGSAALSVQLRRDTLRDLRGGVRLDHEIGVRMRMRVDEAGRDDEAGGVDRLEIRVL